MRRITPHRMRLQKIEAQFCEALGFGEHQRVSAVHTDTDNLHIHVAINKIHPKNLTIHNPYCDYQALGNDLPAPGTGSRAGPYQP